MRFEATIGNLVIIYSIIKEKYWEICPLIEFTEHHFSNSDQHHGTHTTGGAKGADQCSKLENEFL